jgi:hypothetical protein
VPDGRSAGIAPGGARSSPSPAADFDHQDDPGGHAGLGFRRSAEPPHVLEIDPERMPIAVGLFERYAMGNISAKDLAEETGLAASGIRMILMNPLYNGWIRRHRRSDRESLKPAPWRANPPVSDDLWARVEEVRHARTRGGGPKNWNRVDLLGGLLVCVCGRRLRNDGTFADGRHRKQHANPCDAWGRKARLGDETWEAPVLAQAAGIALDEDTMAAVVAALGSSRQPVAIDRARIDRQIRELALEHVAGSFGDEAYLTRLKVLRQQRDAVVERTAAGLPAERAVECSAPSASRSKPRRSRRRRQTCCTPSTTGSRSPAPRSWVSG